MIALLAIGVGHMIIDWSDWSVIMIALFAIEISFFGKNWKKVCMIALFLMIVSSVVVIYKLGIGVTHVIFIVWWWGGDGSVAMLNQ